MEESLNILLQLLIAQTMYALDRIGAGAEPCSKNAEVYACDMDTAASLSSEQLYALLSSLESPKHSGFIADTSEIVASGIHLDTIVKAKCPLLLYVVFFLTSAAAHKISDAWRDIVTLLLYLREARVLPQSLLELDDFADARGEPLAPSIFKQQCFISDKHGQYSLGYGDVSRQPVESTNSAVGLLNPLRWWNAMGMKNVQQQEALSRVHSSSSLESQTFHVSSANTRGARNNITSSPDAVLAYEYGFADFYPPYADTAFSAVVSQVHTLLRACLERCRIDHLLFHRTKEVQLPAVCILVDSILECVACVDEHTTEPRLCHHSEADGVYAVEWVSRIILANRPKALHLWPHLHSVLDFVLDSRATYACRHTPYLVERCAVTVLRAAIHMLDIPALAGRVWQSLRLLRGIPVDIAQYVSDRLGAGLLSLIRVTPQRSTTTEEQWYLLFSLLGAAASVRTNSSFCIASMQALLCCACCRVVKDVPSYGKPSHI
jgi:hypothetical protein